jgi:O-antigen/teichoic acid export membrane protein
MLIPATTYRLNTEDFGIYALMLSVMGLGSSFAFLGVNFVLAAHYQTADQTEKQAMISTMFWFTSFIIILFSLVVWLVWSYLIGIWDALKYVSNGALLLSLFGAITTTPWALAVEVITLKGNAIIYAVVAVLQSIANALVVVICLYIFNLGILSLFAGWAAGGFIMLLGALWALHPYLRLIVKPRWLRELIIIGVPIASSNLLDRVQNTLESYLLSNQTGLVAFAVYNHATRYKNWTMAAVKAFGRSMLDILLDEAQDQTVEFPKTQHGWNIIYGMLAIIGIGFATVGEYVINFLSNGDFTEAYKLVAVWMAILIIQTSGKPALGILLTNNRGVTVTGVSMTSTVIGMVLLIILITYFGVIGAMIATFLQFFIFRLLMYLVSRRIRENSVIEPFALLSIGYIFFTLLISIYLATTPLLDTVLFLVLSCVFVVGNWNIFIEVALRLRQILLGYRKSRAA